MLFERLVLENVGVFRGRHVIDLTPSDRAQPIVLVGALNGSGKTTLIESLQVVLYGRRAQFGYRGADNYWQYIQQLRNRYAEPAEATSIELSLRLKDGRRLRVRRQWHFGDGKVREFAEVYRGEDSVPDQEMTAGWDEEIERLLPSKLSELFFFDGERIEALADPKRSEAVLRTAISSLLGVELVDRLMADLIVVQRRQKDHFLDDSERARLEELDAAIESLKERKRSLHQELSQRQTLVDTAERRVREAQDTLRSRGGERLVQKDALHVEAATLKTNVDGLGLALREAAAGALPLAVAAPYLRKLVDLASHRGQQVQPGDLGGVRLYVEDVRTWLKDQRFAKSVKERLAAYLDRQLESYESSVETESWVDYRGAAPRLLALLEDVLPASVESAQRLSKRRREAEQLLDTIESKIAGLPTEQELEDPVQSLVKAETALRECQMAYSQLEAEIAAIVAQGAELSRTREDLLAKSVEAGDAERTVAYCERSRQTLKSYRAELVKQRRELVESLVLESFTGLSRKNDLAARIAIDPDSMRARLYGVDGEEIQPAQLSAAERQLLAVALLWGLARAAGRDVPVVIDTPLGRLDGRHRELLVDRYFRDASHQVILLSTDEEIDEQISATLDDAISHRYVISYDAARKSSSFDRGYFGG